MYTFPSWLEAKRAHLFGLVERDQLPHALLIHGPPGTGRRILALTLIGHLLDFSDTQSAALASGLLIDPELAPTHPDFSLTQPLPEKRQISIVQIRELIATLSLTSHQRGYKAALINPAQTLNTNSANSLLKTLEEPPGRSVIVLITDSLARLPATIVSRCQQVRVAVPAQASALQWLKTQDPAVAWGPILDLAGGAPLSALQFQKSDVPKKVARFERDVDALRTGRQSPAEVAAAWTAGDPEVCLNWMYKRISGEIIAACGGFDEKLAPKMGNLRLQKGQENLNIERAFADLSYIGELRRLLGSGLNMDLQISGILTRWCGPQAAS